MAYPLTYHIVSAADTQLHWFVDNSNKLTISSTHHSRFELVPSNEGIKFKHGYRYVDVFSVNIFSPAVCSSLATVARTETDSRNQVFDLYTTDDGVLICPRSVQDTPRLAIDLYDPKEPRLLYWSVTGSPNQRWLFLPIEEAEARPVSSSRLGPTK
jgi:hypothetical protein